MNGPGARPHGDGPGAAPGGSARTTGEGPGAAARSGEALSRDVVHGLVRRRLTIAVAESLTGGSLTDALVAVPGASAALRGAVVAYATDLKHTLLGVDADLLRARGAVDPDVALAMARGVRDRLGADVGVATTGVAGPEPQDGRAAGTVHVAVVGPWGEAVRSPDLTGLAVAGRAAVRGAARDAALELLASAVGRSGDAPGTTDPYSTLHRP